MTNAQAKSSTVFSRALLMNFVLLFSKNWGITPWLCFILSKHGTYNAEQYSSSTNLSQFEILTFIKNKENDEQLTLYVLSMEPLQLPRAFLDMKHDIKYICVYSVYNRNISTFFRGNFSAHRYIHYYKLSNGMQLIL